MLKPSPSLPHFTNAHTLAASCHFQAQKQLFPSSTPCANGSLPFHMPNQVPSLTGFLYPEGAQPLPLPPSTEMTKGSSKGSCERALLQGENQNTPTAPCKLPAPPPLSGAQNSWQKQGFHGKRGGEGGWMGGARRTCCLGLPPTGISAVHNPACPTGSKATSHPAHSGPQELTARGHLQFHYGGALR